MFQGVNQLKNIDNRLSHRNWIGRVSKEGDRTPSTLATPRESEHPFATSADRLALLIVYRNPPDFGESQNTSLVPQIMDSGGLLGGFIPNTVGKSRFSLVACEGRLRLCSPTLEGAGFYSDNRMEY